MSGSLQRPSRSTERYPKISIKSHGITVSHCYFKPEQPPDDLKSKETSVGYDSNANDCTQKLFKPARNFILSGKSARYPIKEESIVMNAVNGLTYRDYCLAIGKIIGSLNILAADWTPEGHFCMCLTCEELVDELTEKHQKITIKSHVLTIHRQHEKKNWQSKNVILH